MNNHHSLRAFGRLILSLSCAVAVTGSEAASQTRPVSKQTARVTAAYSARVTRIIDGDTIEVESPGSGRVRVRLEGIDAPEMGQPFSQVSRNFVRATIFEQTITVKPVK